MPPNRPWKPALYSFQSLVVTALGYPPSSPKLQDTSTIFSSVSGIMEKSSMSKEKPEKSRSLANADSRLHLRLDMVRGRNSIVQISLLNVAFVRLYSSHIAEASSYYLLCSGTRLVRLRGDLSHIPPLTGSSRSW